MNSPCLSLFATFDQFDHWTIWTQGPYELMDIMNFGPNVLRPIWICGPNERPPPYGDTGLVPWTGAAVPSRPPDWPPVYSPRGKGAEPRWPAGSPQGHLRGGGAALIHPESLGGLTYHVVCIVSRAQWRNFWFWDGVALTCEGRLWRARGDSPFFPKPVGLASGGVPLRRFATFLFSPSLCGLPLSLTLCDNWLVTHSPLWVS